MEVESKSIEFNSDENLGDFSHISRSFTLLTNVTSAHCPHLRPCECTSIGYARPRLQLPPGIAFFLPTLVQVLSSGMQHSDDLALR